MAVRQIDPIVEAIKSKVSVADYFNNHITRLNPKFRPINKVRDSSLCPFHTDTDPSFHYWGEPDVFKCFGCNAGGDVVQLHLYTRKKYFGENIDRNTARDQLATSLGIDIALVKLDAPSVFAQARTAMLDSKANTPPKHALTLARFASMNDQIKNTHTSIEAKAHNYYLLDLQATVSLGKLD